MVTIGLNCVCLVTQLFFLAQEILQMSRGFKKYKSDFWNYPQLIIFGLYLLYFFYRVNDPTLALIPQEH